jgi:sec-independent protein translocase protein TatB
MFPFEQLSLEMLVVFAFGLMVLGPKDLPVVMRKIGQFVAKLRGMAAEFRASFDELARQSELDALRKEVEALRVGAAHDLASPAPDPIYDYKPYDVAAQVPDGLGFTFPPQPSTTEPPVIAEPPPGEVAVSEAAPAKPPRKPRARKSAEPAAAGETPKPVRKPRARKPATPEDAKGEGADGKDAAE